MTEDQKAAHKARVARKRARDRQPGYGLLLRPGQVPRPNMSERALKANFSARERAKFVRIG